MVRGLRISYGDLEAVRGIDLEVRRDAVFAFLGPNGAGKTTTVEVLEGYLKWSGGEVSVLGIDPQHAGADWRERVGVVLQESAAEPDLTVRECLTIDETSLSTCGAPPIVCAVGARAPRNIRTHVGRPTPRRGAGGGRKRGEFEAGADKGGAPPPHQRSRRGRADR